MDLLADDPSLDLNNPNWRIYSGNQNLPPHFIGPNGSAKSSLIAEGADILGTVVNSVIFYDVTIEEGARVSDSVVMPGTVIKKGAVVEKAILGERCMIHENAVVKSDDGSVKVLGRKGESAAAEGGK